MPLFFFLLCGTSTRQSNVARRIDGRRKMDNSPTKGRVIGMQQHTRIRMYACNQITTYMHRSGSPPLRLCTYTSIVGLTNNGSKDIPSTGASVHKKKEEKREKEEKKTEEMTTSGAGETKRRP